MQYRHLTKNCFTTRSYSPQDDENIVFISYRRTICDKYEARKCAEILEDINGLHYWLDEDDKCMQNAQAENDDIKTAHCIEEGLDVSSALLGIIGPGTFDSPWIPYENWWCPRTATVRETFQPTTIHSAPAYRSFDP